MVFGKNGMAASKQVIKPIAFLAYIDWLAQTAKLLITKNITDAAKEPAITGKTPFLFLR